MIIEVDFKALGLAISKYRHRANLSQEKLAEKVGVSTNFIGNIERGAGKPSVTTLLGISVALSLPLDELLDPSIARVVGNADDHTLRDSSAGYVNTLSSMLLSEMAQDEDGELTSQYALLEIEDSLLPSLAK